MPIGRMMALSPLFCALLLTGCATESEAPGVRYVHPRIPASLLSCETAPEVPERTATQRDVARYIVLLHAAGLDCREKLATVGRLWEPDV